MHTRTPLTLSLSALTSHAADVLKDAGLEYRFLLGLSDLGLA